MTLVYILRHFSLGLLFRCGALDNHSKAPDSALTPSSGRWGSESTEDCAGAARSSPGRHSSNARGARDVAPTLPASAAARVTILADHETTACGRPDTVATIAFMAR